MGALHIKRLKRPHSFVVQAGISPKRRQTTFSQYHGVCKAVQILCNSFLINDLERKIIDLSTWVRVECSQ